MRQSRTLIPQAEMPRSPQSAEKVTLFTSAVRPQNRDELIGTAAYYHAERRGFEPGHELDDWLAAERDVDAQLARTDPDAFLADNGDAQVSAEG